MLISLVEESLSKSYMKVYKIPLTNSGKFAIVDENGLLKVTLLRKKHKEEGFELKFYSTNKGYARTTRHPQMMLHHLIFGKPKNGLLVDHKNRNKLDCRIKNLRSCTHRESCINRKLRSDNKSGYKGVTYSSDTFRKRMWGASITVEGEQIGLGHFWTVREAAKAYDRAALKYHGEFAALNFQKGML